MRIAIIGARGMLGTALLSAFPGHDVVGLDRTEFELTDAVTIARQLTAIAPGVVVNAAAYTDVDGCEREYDRALAVNGTAVGTLAAACRELNARLVHFSTDYVFDGNTPAGYPEDAQPNPLSAYGRSKVAGERLLQASGCRFLLIRTSWLFGSGRGDNVVEKIIARAKQDGRLQLVNDRWGKPTYARDLAIKTAELVNGGHHENRICHLTNVTPPSGITWYEFGKAIVLLLGLAVEVTPCRSAEFPQAAVRPVHSLLVNTKVPSLRPWREALKEYLETRNVKRET